MRKLIFLAILFIASAHGAEQPRHSYKPESGYIPNEETAIAVAVAVWKPIYGASQIESEKPYVATLIGGVWHVRGTLPEGWKGGVAEAEISKSDGTILRVSHGK